MICANDFFRLIYFEEGAGEKVTLGGKTNVDLDPETKPATSAETASAVVRDKNRETIDFPQQNGPTNPIDRIRRMYRDSIEASTRRAQQRQWGRYRDQ